MSIIRVLSAEVAGRIAAGEVVERPASVVKELVENSIDAGATRIRIATEQGGQRLIQITDNGCGMDRDDAILCFEAHATSKISTEADVGQIRSLGFRGEAIPSISSVSRFTLQTRRHDEEAGTEICVEYGIIRDVQDCGCAPGTTIKVANLFGNLPARRKFLKGPDTEDSHIEEMVLQLALARPDIAFSLIQNGRESLRATATADIGARILALLGRDAYAAMLPVHYEEDGISVKGFISKPGFTRTSRHDQRTVVNGRTATADTIFYAIRDAYESLVIKGRYPSTVLYISLPPDRVDVNVHPTKREVRFRDPRLVGTVISTALREALRNMPGGADHSGAPIIGPAPEPFHAQPRQISLPLPQEPTPSWTESASRQIESKARRSPSQTETPLPSSSPFQPSIPSFPTKGESNRQMAQTSTPTIPAGGKKHPANGNLTADKAPNGNLTADNGHHPAAQPSAIPSCPSPSTDGATMTPLPESAIPSGNKDLASLQFRGRLSNRYLLAESPNGLVIVDLRAAHQRILFEKLLHNLKEHSVPQQRLLLPVTVNLGLDEARFLKSQLEHFQSLGFTVEHFGGNDYIVTAVPADYPNQDIAHTLRDIIDDLRQSRTTHVQSTIHVAQAACRHAIGLKDSLTALEIQQLLHQLACAAMPYADPNGNPTMIHITFAELNKRFKN